MPRTAVPAGVPGTLGMVSDKVWTSAELGRTTPAEQDALFESSLTNNLEDVPADSSSVSTAGFAPVSATTSSRDRDPGAADRPRHPELLR